VVVSLQFAAQILRFIAISILAAEKPQHPLTAPVTVLVESCQATRQLQS
jgi:hypothetical protein